MSHKTSRLLKLAAYGLYLWGLGYMLILLISYYILWVNSDDTEIIWLSTKFSTYPIWAQVYGSIYELVFVILPWILGKRILSVSNSLSNNECLHIDMISKLRRMIVLFALMYIMRLIYNQIYKFYELGHFSLGFLIDLSIMVFIIGLVILLMDVIQKNAILKTENDLTI